MTTSVIMINRNGGTFLREALRSLRLDLERTWQTRRDFELLIIDNGSTDDSLATMDAELRDATFAWRVVVENTPGVNSARNAGLKHAAGDFLIYIDSDLQFHPGWLAAYVDAETRHPGIEVFAGRVEVGIVEGPVPDWLDLKGPWKRPAIVVQSDHGAEPAVYPLSDERGPVGPNMAFRRSIFARAGAFDTQFGLRPGSLLAGAEAEFFDRLARQNVSFAWVPGAAVDHPLKRGQISRQYFLTRLHGTGRVTARIFWMRRVECKRIFGLTRYRIPELLRAIARWLLMAARGEPRRAFFYRGQVSILAGWLHEDFLIWRGKSGTSQPVVEPAVR